MNSVDLAQRTRPRASATPVGQICAEVSRGVLVCPVFFFESCSHGRSQSASDVYSVYWPEMPLPGSVPRQQRRDSSADIEMLPLASANSGSVAVSISADVDRSNE